MRIFLIVSIVILFGCETQESATKGVGYFDIETYILQLDESVTIQKNVTKTVKLNGETETETIENYNITPELRMMNKYNINKPALSGKFEETIEGDKVVYTAKDNDAITRKMMVTRRNDEVQRIEIEGLQKSILSESRQTIIFEPEKSFLLKSEDRNRYTKDITKEVLIEY